MTLQNQEFIAGLKQIRRTSHRFLARSISVSSKELDNLELENVTLLDMTDQSQLAVKKRIEIDEPEQQFYVVPRCPQRVHWLWIFVFIVTGSTPISPPLR